jgi:hypothetical protein
MRSTNRFIDDEAIVDDGSDQEDQTSDQSCNSVCNMHNILIRQTYHLSMLGFLDDGDEGGLNDSDPDPEPVSSTWSDSIEREVTDKVLRQIASDICNRH